MLFRKDPVEYLLRREFPDYQLLKGLAAASFSRGSVPVDSKERERRASRLKEYEQRQENLWTLQLTDPQQFRKVLDAEVTKDWEESRQRTEREEQERFFNQPHARADFNHWAKMPYWTLHECVALWFGKEPSVVKWEAIKTMTEISSFAKQFKDTLDIAERAVAMDQISQSNVPNFFIAWANRLGPPFPTELVALVEKKGPIADWRTLYERERNAHAELQVRADKAAALAQAQPNELSGKPTKIRGDRENNLLRVIAGLWALSGLPVEQNTTADKISGLFDSWGWDKPAKGTIADTVLAEAAKLQGAKIRK